MNKGQERCGGVALLYSNIDIFRLSWIFLAWVFVLRATIRQWNNGELTEELRNLRIKAD